MTTAETVAVTGKSKANGKSGRKNAVGNFIVDAIDGGVMKAFVEAKKIKLDDYETDEQLGVALTTYFRGTTSDDNMAQCARCLGEAPEDIADCPFCGLQGNVTGAVVAPPIVASAPESAPAIVPEVVASGDAAPPDVPVSADKKAAAKAKKDAKAAEKNGATAPGLAKAPAALANTTERDLDNALAEVMKWKSASAAGYWMLGATLREINEKQLWKQRGAANGKPAYKSFEAFVDAECHMTAGHAYSAIDIAKAYSEEKMKRIGQTNAMLILKVPAEARAQLEEKAEAGATTSTIREESKKLRQRVGNAKKGKKAEAGAAGAKARAKKLAARADKEKITVAAIEGRKVFALYKKPETMRNLDMGQLTRAKTLADIPFGKVEMVGDLAIYFSVRKNKDGLLQGVCEIKRETQDEE